MNIFMRIVRAILGRMGSAKDNLSAYLKAHIRREIIDPMKLGTLLVSINESPYIQEEMIDMFIDDKLGEDLQGVLMGHVQHKEKVSDNIAEEVIGAHKALSEDTRAILDKVQTDMTRIGYDYIRSALMKRYQEYSRRKEEEPTYEEGMPEPVTPPESEMEEDMLREHALQKNLIKDSIRHINDAYDSKKRKVMKYILKELFLAKKPKTLKEIGDQIEMSHESVRLYRDQLLKSLGAFLAQKGYGKITDVKDKELPDYREELKKQHSLEDFKRYLKEMLDPRMSEDTKKILEFFSKGYSSEEVAKELSIPIERVRTQKIKRFDPIYRAWYEDKELRVMAMRVIKGMSLDYDTLGDFEGLVCAFTREQEKKWEEALKKHEKKEEVKKHVEERKEKEDKRKEKEEGAGEETAGHSKLVEWAIEHNRFIMTLVFSSDYDNIDVIAGRKDPKKDDAHFKYISCKVIMSEERQKHSVGYEYSQKLLDDGSLDGAGESTLKLDGEKVVGYSKLQGQLETFVKDKILPQGVLPHKYVGATYVNHKTGKVYKNVHDFSDAFRGIGFADKAHKEREEYHKKLEQKREMGVLPTGIAMTRALHTKLKLQLFEEKKKDPVDKQLVDKLQKELDDIEALLSKKINTQPRALEMLHKVKEDLHIEETRTNKDEQKIKVFKEQIRLLEGVAEDLGNTEQEVGDLMDKLEELRKPEELLHAAAVEGFPVPGTAGSLGILADLLKAYKIDSPDFKGWLEEADVISLARKLREAGASKEEMLAAFKGFEALPTSLKSRRDHFERAMNKAGTPERFKEFSKGKKIYWVDRVEDIDKVIFEVGKILKAPHEKEIFPKPEHKAVKDLIDVLKGYDLMHKPDPLLWLGPDDLVVMAHSLRGVISNKVESDLKGLKGKDDTPEKQQDIKDRGEKDIAIAIKGFEALPEDLKARRDKFKKDNEAAYKELSKRHNFSWVDESTEKLLTRLMGIFKEPFKMDKGEKQKSVHMLEKNKYHSLEAYLKNELTGVGRITDLFAEAPLEKKDPELIAKLTAEADKSEVEVTDLNKVLTKMHKSVEELGEVADESFIKEMVDLEKDIIATRKYIHQMRIDAKAYDEHPALAVAKVLLGKLSYFSKIYSILVGILWFRYHHLEKFSAEVKKDIDSEQLRRQIINELNHVSSRNVWDKDEIRLNIGRAKVLLNKFIGEQQKLKCAYDTYIDDEGPVFMYTLAAEDWQSIHKVLLPADELHHAQLLVHQIDTSGVSKKVRALQSMAQEELDRIVKNLSEAYSKEKSVDTIKALAKKKGISEDEAAKHLRTLEDNLARYALKEFIFKWKNIISGMGKEKERSPLNNRPSQEYEKMEELVDTLLPELFQRMPPEIMDVVSEPDLPSSGVPTPKDIREFIEEAYTKHKPSEMTEGVDYSELFYGAPEGGTSKSKSKNKRKKKVKPPPPSGIYEELKEQLVRLIKGSSARKVVHTILAQYMHRIKKMLDTTTDEEYVAVADVIDGLVALLKHLYYQILKLNVEPSAKLERIIRKPGKEGDKVNAPEGLMTGLPDITIDNAKEAEDLFDKLKEIYKEINYYIAPDKVGIPPENLSKITSKSSLAKKYLPAGLVYWYQHLQEQEEKKTPEGAPKAPEKKVEANQMTFRVASKFVGMPSMKETIFN